MVISTSSFSLLGWLCCFACSMVHFLYCLSLFPHLASPSGSQIALVVVAALIEHNRLGSLNNRNLFFHGSGGWKCKVKVLVGLVSPDASHRGLQMIILLLPLHMVTFCVHTPLVSLPLLTRAPIILDLVPISMAHFNSITSLKNLFPNIITF